MLVGIMRCVGHYSHFLSRGLYKINSTVNCNHRWDGLPQRLRTHETIVGTRIKNSFLSIEYLPTHDTGIGYSAILYDELLILCFYSSTYMQAERDYDEFTEKKS